MRGGFAVLAAVVTTIASPAVAGALPEGVTALLDAAADDPGTLDVVSKAARRAYPDAAADIEAYVATLIRRQAPNPSRDAPPRGSPARWTGEGELGGSISTGNTEERGIFASLTLHRETATWGHQVELAVDHQSEDGDTSKDRYFGGYTINRNFTPRLYAAASFSAERDRFAGYDYRFSENLALGYRVVDRPDLELRIEAGPGLRQSDYLDVGKESSVAGYAAAHLSWDIGSGLQFTQTVDGYLDSRNSTLAIETALIAELRAGISARASYEYRFEDDPPEDRERMDTTTRVTIVFSF